MTKILPKPSTVPELTTPVPPMLVGLELSVVAAEEVVGGHHEQRKHDEAASKAPPAPPVQLLRETAKINAISA